LQAETQNNQLKAAIPAHSAPELGDDVSASWSNNIGRPTIEFEFSVLRCRREKDLRTNERKNDELEMRMKDDVPDKEIESGGFN